jgi:hypothetical protein
MVYHANKCRNATNPKRMMTNDVTTPARTLTSLQQAHALAHALMSNISHLKPIVFSSARDADVTLIAGTLRLASGARRRTAVRGGCLSPETFVRVVASVRQSCQAACQQRTLTRAVRSSMSCECVDDVLEHAVDS